MENSRAPAMRSKTWSSIPGSARLEWVRACAREVAKLSLEGLALPCIAAGLGGLEWDDAAAVVEVELAPLPYLEVWSLL